MGVNYSPGASGLISGIRFVERYTPNYTEWCYPNSGITVHHAASTSSSGCDAFEDRSRNASAHYYVCDDQIQWWVSEKDGAWHGGASFPNTCTIGIETKNSSGSPDWLVAEKTFDNLARLMADIAIRHEWGKLVVGKNVWGHRDFSATACPGPYLYPRLDSLVRRANEYIEGKSDPAKYGESITAADRYKTSEAIAKKVGKKVEATAKGDTFPDAASIMWLAGKTGSGFAFASGYPNVKGCVFGGANRFETQALSMNIADHLGIERPKKCFVVGNEAEADAAVCAEASYRLGIPIVFSDSDKSAFTEQIKVGGKYPNRDETAVAFAEEYATDWSTVWLCAHSAWSDMMAAAQRGDGTPMLFYGNAAIASIKKHKPKKLVFVGGITEAQKEAAWKASQ